MNDVVKLEWVETSIAVVTMDDIEGKNIFSEDLIYGLNNVFGEIKKNIAAKVIVLKGTDSYFCCGWPKEILANAFSAESPFSDLLFIRLLLDCELPVIAAMQGDALREGLAFSAFADVMVMAEEATYACNFLEYGITPGFGSTYIIPKKFGSILAAELLYTAKEYEGIDLKARHVPIKVVKKSEVLNIAMTIAKDFNDKPIVSLKLLKKHLTQAIREELPKYIDEELAGLATLFQSAESRDKIKKLIEKNFHV